jgi:ferredoxin, 2Fe-2S
MPIIHFFEHDGTQHDLSGEIGESVMHIARSAGLPGIIADCGGECACATCHAYVDPAFVDIAGTPSQDELDMLEGAIETNAQSRLTCQIKVTAALDGLIVRLPASQI